MNDKKEDQEKDIKIEADENLDDSVIAEESAEETIKKLRLKLKKALEEKQEYLTGWQRTKADFINARKRDEELQKDFIKYSNEGLISSLIPVLDSFNMAMGNKESWERVDKNWRVGVEYISNQLKKVLEDNGLKEINPIGQKFDPNRDEAVEYVKVSDQKQDHVVISVTQRFFSK